MRSYVIIGNGITGTTAADAIRELDRQGRITIITDEEYSFYPRKGLSLFMTGEIREDDKFRAKDELQELIDKYNEKIEKMGERKKEELKKMARGLRFV